MHPTYYTILRQIPVNKMRKIAVNCKVNGRFLKLNSKLFYEEIPFYNFWLMISLPLSYSFQFLNPEKKISLNIMIKTIKLWMESGKKILIFFSIVFNFKQQSAVIEVMKMQYSIFLSVSNKSGSQKKNWWLQSNIFLSFLCVIPSTMKFIQNIFIA